MDFKNKTIKAKGGIIGAIALPLIYIILLFITNDPDFIIFILGPFSIIIWLIQWISWLFGGWILAIILTILSLSLTGLALGILIGSIINKLKNK